jgi:hypothetical protein
MASNDNNKRQ